MTGVRPDADLPLSNRIFPCTNPRVSLPRHQSFNAACALFLKRVFAGLSFDPHLGSAGEVMEQKAGYSLHYLRSEGPGQVR
jgi:hypothetical protein